MPVPFQVTRPAINFPQWKVTGFSFVPNFLLLSSHWGASNPLGLGEQVYSLDVHCPVTRPRSVDTHIQAAAPAVALRVAARLCP